MPSSKDKYSLDNLIYYATHPKHEEHFKYWDELLKKPIKESKKVDFRPWFNNRTINKKSIKVSSDEITQFFNEVQKEVEFEELTNKIRKVFIRMKDFLKNIKN